MTLYGIINDLYVVDFSLGVLIPRFIDIMEKYAMKSNFNFSLTNIDSVAFRKKIGLGEVYQLIQNFTKKKNICHTIWY